VLQIVIDIVWLAHLVNIGRSYTTSAMEHLGLGECGAKGCVLDSQLVDERATFFPPTIGFISGGEGGIEKLRAGLECLYMSGMIFVVRVSD
jgi:hypothetical protein